MKTAFGAIARALFQPCRPVSQSQNPSDILCGFCPSGILCGFRQSASVITRSFCLFIAWLSDRSQLPVPEGCQHSSGIELLKAVGQQP